MLTRLKVSGFKNLIDVDVRFGPFTCIAGANGVGKSNLFDAIRFLSALADRPLIDAALSVRDEGGRTADVRSIFHRVGENYANEMAFEVEMIVPKEGYDDLGQEAKAGITFLRYSVAIAYRREDSTRSLGSLELLREELTHITLGDARQHLLFPHSPEWRRSAITGRRSAPFFISTEGEGTGRLIRLHHESSEGVKSGGRPLSRLASTLPRTVLSTTNAAENRTALLARREMQSWRLLQLEPSSLRKPDEFTAETRLGTDGAHLAATLYHLARSNKNGSDNNDGSEAQEHQTYGQVANRLSELIDGVREIGIDRDERRELLTMQMTGTDGTTHPARALSDGTLRFLALAVIELDPQMQGVLCLEEPENGIHPERIPAMLRLLQDIAADVEEPVGPDNPLRQVIINTHSPAVVAQISDDSLLVAEWKEMVRGDERFKRVAFSCLPETWRTKSPETDSVVDRGILLAYLNPVSMDATSQSAIKSNGNRQSASHKKAGRRRVIDRPDLQLLIPFWNEPE